MDKNKKAIYIKIKKQNNKIILYLNLFVLSLFTRLTFFLTKVIIKKIILNMIIDKVMIPITKEVPLGKTHSEKVYMVFFKCMRFIGWKFASLPRELLTI